MKRIFQLQLAACVLAAVWCSAAGAVNVGVAYLDPVGGWTYAYTGDAAVDGGGSFNSLDGTWDHDNGSDAWDGTGPGVGRPGGVGAGLTDGNTAYAGFQDTGDPRDYGMPDPSNRKLYFGNDLSSEGDRVLDDGITISFRARLSTGSPLDDAHPNGGGGVVPWPAGGDGYVVANNGRGMFGVNQKTSDEDFDYGVPGILPKPARISFALTNSADLGGNLGDDIGGLVMNDLDGNTISENVDPGEGAGGTNGVLISDTSLTEWHEFWITIASDASDTGTHAVNVYMDGSIVPRTFLVTAGFDDSRELDYDLSFLAMGMGNTGQSGAFDVDFLAYTAGVVDPVPEPSTLIIVGFAALGLFAARRRRDSA